MTDPNDNSILLVEDHSLVLITNTNAHCAFFLQGACINSGAERTLIGLNQSKAYCNFVGIPVRPMQSENQFRFGEDQQTAVGYISIRFSIEPEEMSIHRTEVVHWILRI